LINYNYFSVIRLHQWSKNFLIFLPLVSSHQFTLPIFYLSFYAFIAFCLIASSTYILNDILDIKNDQDHPKKKYRAFASNQLSIKSGIFLALILFLFSITLSLKINLIFFFIVILYFIMTCLYSVYLKKFAIIDIFLLSFFYTIRIIAGGFATNISISFWLICFAFFIFLSLACVKRISEIRLLNINTNNLFGRAYKFEDLNFIMSMSVASGFISIVIFALYINSDTISNLYRTIDFLLFIPLILFFWISRVIFLAQRNKIASDPIIFAFKDKISWLSLFLIAVILFASKYY